MKKNIICILCDQLRPDFLSCYNSQSPVSTPNIDQLAKNGLLFQNATTASPVCAPGRACMMTGRYVSDHKVWSNDLPFRDGMEYLPMRMKANGYVCGAFGKLHHFPAKDSKGFDIAWQMEENRLDELQDDYFKYLKNLHPEIKRIFNFDEANNFIYSPEEYYESQIALHAIDFINQYKDDSPFFAWISFQGPHGPMDPPKIHYNTTSVPEPILPGYDPHSEVALYRKYRTKHRNASETQTYRLKYAQMIEFIDMKIGQIITYLKQNNLYEHTNILFTTDHGDLCGDYSMYQKGPFLYNAQLEVPMILSNCSQLPTGSTSDILVSNLDVPSTILDLAGDQMPLAYSRSICAMYHDKKLQRNSCYSEFCDSMKLVSDQTYRFAYYPFTGEYELVEIANETVDLSKKPEYYPKVIYFLKEIIDYMVIAKGVCMEAHDITPKVHKGLLEKLPTYQDDLPIAMPIAKKWELEALKEHGLDPTINEFCIGKDTLCDYGKYWE